ncbi:MAG: tripartite tricarboxylate transporter substrate binding protein [Betaproteobacteria bacterium]|nr:tripartite tricarboxylate transporter substrate binding protein [Betaproteobacteria bacterium]
MIIRLVCLVFLLSFVGTAAAQKTLRLVVPYGAGGAPDVMSRTLAAKLSERNGHPVIVDNRPGASGIIAAQLVQQAAPDGQTLFVADTGHFAINVSLHSKLPYDPRKDFVPVIQAISTPLFLAVNSSLPVHNVNELIALARSKPEGLSYGSSGNGSVHHLGMAQITAVSGAKLTHVPYKGVAQSVPAVLSGDVAAAFFGLPSILPHVKSGKARLIGVTERTPLMPEVVPVADQLPGFSVRVTVGFLAPAGTPPDVVKRLNADIASVLNTPDVQERLRVLGIDKIAGTPDQFRDVIHADIERYAKIVKETGARAD